MLPEWEKGADPRGSVDIATMSYSLSMIPSYHAVLDRIEGVLNPQTGFVLFFDTTIFLIRMKADLLASF